MKSLDLAPSVFCPHCNSQLQADAHSFDVYFSGQRSCPGCKKDIDWWQVVLTMVEHQFHFHQVVILAGAEAKALQTTLRPGETKELSLVEYGVPEDAEILYLNLTSMGSAIPVLLHGNEVLREPVGPRLSLFGRPTPPELRGDGNLSVSVTWFVRRSDDTVIRHLVEAAKHYQAARFDALIMPANIAAEVSVTSTAELGLSGFANKKKLDGATYSHQLNVLLGLTAFLAKFPRLPGHIRNILNDLRKLRNTIAHEGACSAQDRSKAAGYFTAALFVTHYARLLKQAINEARAAGELP